MLTLFPDPSPKSAKMSNTISRMLWSRDRFHGNKILQFVNTRPNYYCSKFGGGCFNILGVIAIYVIFCKNELEP